MVLSHNDEVSAQKCYRGLITKYSFLTPSRESKHKLYLCIKFPGSHYTMKVSRDQGGGFTFSELINTNYDSFQGHIFIGGILN